jgi:hypothetical protein
MWSSGVRRSYPPIASLANAFWSAHRRLLSGTQNLAGCGVWGWAGLVGLLRGVQKFSRGWLLGFLGFIRVSAVEIVGVFSGAKKRRGCEAGLRAGFAGLSYPVQSLRLHPNNTTPCHAQNNHNAWLREFLFALPN